MLGLKGRSQGAGTAQPAGAAGRRDILTPAVRSVRGAAASVPPEEGETLKGRSDSENEPWPTLSSHP